MSGRRVLGALGVLAVIVLAILLVTSPAFQALLGSILSNTHAYPAEGRAELIRELSIDASGGEVVDFTALAVVPHDVYIEGELVQEVVSVSYYPTPDTETVNGTEWAVWAGGPLSEDEVFVSTVSYEVVLRAYAWDLEPEDSLGVELIGRLDGAGAADVVGLGHHLVAVDDLVVCHGGLDGLGHLADGVGLDLQQPGPGQQLGDHLPAEPLVGCVGVQGVFDHREHPLLEAFPGGLQPVVDRGDGDLEEIGNVLLRVAVDVE